MLFFCAFCMVTGISHGQNVTYIHDDAKDNQIQVMELGTGALSPQLYYWMVHNGYLDDAKDVTSVKNLLRISASTASLPQVAMSDSIRSYLDSRAQVEAMNVADREIDVAWLTERGKIENALMSLKNNIGCLTGKTTATEIEAWKELTGLYDCAIKATRQGYMPNSERQKQYLAIYDEITEKNEQLLLRVRYLATKIQADRLVAATSQFQHRVRQNATVGYNRWRDASRNGAKRE